MLMLVLPRRLLRVGLFETGSQLLITFILSQPRVSICIRGWGDDRCQNIFGNGSKQPRGRSVWQVAPPPQARSQDFILGAVVSTRSKLPRELGAERGSFPLPREARKL